MSADQNTLAGLENQAFALMARMHVIIRRQSGRVTDIEYMRLDPVYCRHVLKMARDLPNDDLPQLCEKLQEIYFGPEGLFVRAPPRQPLMSRLSNTSDEAQMGGTASSASSAETEPLPAQSEKEASEQHHIELNEALEKAYIGRLR
jgi:hypothetical protein